MRKVWWEHVHVDAPASEVASVMPLGAAAGGSELEVLHERTAEGAFWGARRFRAVWSDGRRNGKADVEIRPRSSWATELVVRLEAPRLLWSRESAGRSARALGLALRDEILRRVPAGESRAQLRAKTS